MEAEDNLYSLFGAARSSCSFRVRIALNLLGLRYRNEACPPGERTTPAFRALNPQSLVPLLVGENIRIGQSVAIMEYLNELHGGDGAAILPDDPLERARVRSLALYVCCDIQPLQNTRIDKSLESDGAGVLKFKRHWIGEGLASLERALSDPQTGQFCHGDRPTIADCCIIPQVWNALNVYSLTLDTFPKLRAIYERCLGLPAFQKALPENQPDYTP
eukprot:jgi/Botrbrau1/6051/Bobra.0042s0034.3